MLTTTSYPDKEICKKCMHYKETRGTVGIKRQVLAGICQDCYGIGVFIVKHFQEPKKDEELICSDQEIVENKNT